MLFIFSLWTIISTLKKNGKRPSGKTFEAGFRHRWSIRISVGRICGGHRSNQTPPLPALDRKMCMLMKPRSKIMIKCGNSDVLLGQASVWKCLFSYADDLLLAVYPKAVCGVWVDKCYERRNFNSRCFAWGLKCTFSTCAKQVDTVDGEGAFSQQVQNRYPGWSMSLAAAAVWREWRLLEGLMGRAVAICFRECKIQSGLWRVWNMLWGSVACSGPSSGAQRGETMWEKTTRSCFLHALLIECNFGHLCGMLPSSTDLDWASS